MRRGRQAFPDAKSRCAWRSPPDSEAIMRQSQSGDASAREEHLKQLRKGTRRPTGGRAWRLRRRVPEDRRQARWRRVRSRT
jgi:hypothetical protein